MPLCRHSTYRAASTVDTYCIRSASSSFFIQCPHRNLLSIESISRSMSSAQHHPDKPAFTALLDVYARWQDFEQTPAQGISNPRNGSGDDEHAHLPRPKSAPLDFIMSCPYIDIPDIPDDERNCPICTDPYHHLSDRAGEPDSKIAQRLPCGHYLCNCCLYQWLNPYAQSNNNTCPFDRRVLFPKFAHFLSTEGIQQRLNLVDWFHQVRGRPPAGDERDLTLSLKLMLVQRRLGEAVDELEVDGCSIDNLMQSNASARACDPAFLSACQQFEHRLKAIGAISNSIEGHMQALVFQR